MDEIFDGINEKPDGMFIHRAFVLENIIQQSKKMGTHSTTLV